MVKMKTWLVSVLLLLATLAITALGCGSSGVENSTDTESDTNSDTDSDTNRDTDSDTDTETNPDTEPLTTTVGQVSSGALLKSSNYSMRVTVGGSPMASVESDNYSASVGVGALVNQ